MPPVALGALEARLPRTPLTRFAPSPTGYLHLGHVVNAVWVWGLARALAGRVLLRIEDHDRGRCRPEYEEALLEDLAWLGLVPDLGPTRQRDADAMYLDTLAALEQRGLVYACDCSRRDISREAGDVPHLETPYSGRCRDRGLPPESGRGQRLRLEQQVERFTDALLGEQEQTPALQCGDLLLRDRHGNWTYQFAVVVDDLRQGVDLVVRGADLVGSTGRQIALGRLLGPGRSTGVSASPAAPPARRRQAEQGRGRHRDSRASRRRRVGLRRARPGGPKRPGSPGSPAVRRR